MINAYLNKVYQTGSYIEKFILCSIPIVNLKMEAIASKAFDDETRALSKQKITNIKPLSPLFEKKRQFKEIFFWGMQCQGIALIAAFILFKPVTLGISLTGLIYAGNYCVSLLKYTRMNQDDVIHQRQWSSNQKWS